MLVIKLQEDNYLANVFHIAKLRFIKTIVLFVVLHLQLQDISILEKQQMHYLCS